MPNRKKVQEIVPLNPEPVSDEPEFYDVELEKARQAFATDIDRSLVRYGFTLIHSLTPELQARVLKHLDITRGDSSKDQYNLGCVLAMDGDFKGASAAFAAAVRLDAEFPEASYNLALALERSGEKAAAKEQWNHYASLVQNDAEREQILAHIGTLA
jgi:tetratricopeptide (TPR) repeat protein